jgi:uncharacterized protein YjbI with pentapeptide repeats
MKTAEVIERYKNGRRDFRGESLRGCNFKDQDLSWADFSGCDIRGANFSEANLTGAKFKGAKAGLRKRSVVILLLLSLVLLIFSSSFPVVAEIVLVFDEFSTINQVAAWVSLILLISFCILGQQKNILAIGAGGAVVVVVVAAAVAGVMPVGTGILEVAVSLVGAIVLTVGVVSAVVSAGVLSGAVLAATGVGLATEIVIAGVAVAGVVGARGLAIARVVGARGVVGVTGVRLTLVEAGALALFFTWMGWRTLKQEHRDPWLRKIVIAFAGLGGTSFFNATLTATDFTGATLKNTNFNQAKLNKTIFKQAIKLELARPGTTLLVNPQVRELLINPSTGADQDLTKADLRGGNLDGANLQRTNLRLADLSQASFKYANLREANLTEVNAVNADLSYAALTGACVENWNIDATTQLAEVDCQYIYLLNNQKERRPSSGEFEPGEFTQLFKEVFDTVDLIFRDGMDWKALMNTLKEVQVQNEDTPLHVQAIENKGNGVFVVNVHVPPDANKEKIHQELTEIYKIKAQLTAQDEQLKFLREQNTDLMQIIKIQANNQTKVEISYNKQDQSQAINVGQDLTIEAKDSTVNLRDIH